MIGGRPAPGRFLGWEERGQLFPLFICQVTSTHHTTELTHPDEFFKHAIMFVSIRVIHG